MRRIANRVSRFQSARPRGRTRPDFTPAPRKGDVSIRASSREDATFPVCRNSGRFGFNPRVLAGGHDVVVSVMVWIFKFQSARPRGRTRQRTSDSYKSQRVSIRASSREDTTIRKPPRIGTARFNPRVLAGGHDSVTEMAKQNKEFQSARPRGRTRLPRPY